MNILKSGPTVFSYEVNNSRSYAASHTVKADVMVETAGQVMDVMHLVADIIQRAKPTQLPMVWSKYRENIWKSENVEPVVTIHPNRVVWNDATCVYSRGNFPSIQEVIKAGVVIYVTCEPCWETYRRWSSVIIDQFYKAARAVRDYFGINWEDVSKTQDVTWGEVEFGYLSKEPIHIIRQEIPTCNYYGETVDQRVTEVRVHFALTIPNFPDDQKDAANCHVIEEEVTTTSTRKVKRLRCE